MKLAKTKPFYELAFWLKDEGPMHDPASEFEEAKKTIVELGGEIRRASHPRRRRLAYRIKKQMVGFFSYIHFHLRTSALHELREALEHNKNILRYLIVKKLEEKELVQKVRPRAKKEEVVPPDTDEFEKKLAEILGTQTI